MVRQVFSNRVFADHIGEKVDEQQIEVGLRESRKVLNALEDLVGDNDILTGADITLADIHLAPTIAYFSAAPLRRLRHSSSPCRGEAPGLGPIGAQPIEKSFG